MNLLVLMSEFKIQDLCLFKCFGATVTRVYINNVLLSFIVLDIDL